MKKRIRENADHQSSKITKLITAGIIIALLLSLVFLFLGTNNSLQASTPIIAGVSFKGDYKIADGPWMEIIPDKHISSTKGDVTLRGYFQLHDPTTNEVIGPLGEGSTVSLYFNHIRGKITMPNGYHMALESENEILGEDACASMWGYYEIVTSGSTADINNVEPFIVNIELHNPHHFGNENAIDEFLENISVAPGIYLEETMVAEDQTERNLGITIVISAIIIIGIAFFSSVVHIKTSKEMWLIGLMSLFAGGYFVYDTFAISLWNSPNIENTRMLGLCMMFYMLFATGLISTLLNGLAKKIALSAAAVSGVSIVSCISVSFLRSVKFYDTLFWWMLIQAVCAVTVIICQICSFKRATTAKKLLYSLGILMLSSFLLDCLATKLGWWEGGLSSKNVFILIFLLVLIVVLRVIPSHINAAMKARQLEAERQVLQLELQESRISIMLSQMQPHFIFNTLNTIYHLCEIDPELAKSTISSFSEYLRNNIDTLGQSEMISFEKELSFVKTYLDIEKVRFDDELEIDYDIQTTNFKLPVLTIQPLVENAVKHGTSKKDGVSQLRLSTKETEKYIEIVIQDTGVGFNTAEYKNDGHKHIGISSVKQRLENLCNGTLCIESEPGIGTKATVIIPKGDKRST